MKTLDMHEKILVAFILAAFLIRMILINQDISIILNKFLADDSYYYYSIAQNIAEGKGAVFNDGAPTNGFHPLYAFLLVPIFKIFLNFGLDSPIYVSLIALSIFSVGTSIFLYLTVRKLLNKNAALFASFVWLFNPYVLFVSLIGVETSIQIFFLSALVYFIVNIKSSLTKLDCILIGGLIGLVFLSRMDGVFIGIGVVASLFIRKLDKTKFSIFKQFDIFLIILIAALVVSPWFLWSLMNVGRITPVSGEAINILASSNLTDKSYIGLVKHAVYSTLGFVAKFFLQISDRIEHGIAVVSLFLVLPFVFLLIKKDVYLLKLFRNLDFLVIGSVLYFAFYWFYQLGIREWYSGYTTFLLSIIFPIFLFRVIDKLTPMIGKFVMFVFISILSLSFLFGGITHYQRGNFPQEQLKWEVANYIDHNIPSEYVIGSYNTGVYQYYTRHHDVINLDGVVNPEVLEAMKENKFDDLILKKNITYIVDRPYYADKVNKSVLTLEPIKTFELKYQTYKNEDGKEIITLFKVIPT